MITSSSNAQIKNISQLIHKPKARKEQDCFVVEGIKMFQEIPEGEMLGVYVSESFLEIKENREALTKYQYEIVSDKVFKTITDTVTPQGILALVRKKHYMLEDLLDKDASDKCFLILENIRDPGNLGTIIRTGEGAGISGIILSKESVDIYNNKVIRSTMGSIFRVPFLYVEDLPNTINLMKAHKITIYAAHLLGKNITQMQHRNTDSAIIIGNESNGISEEIKNISDKLIKIPMCGQVESLNAAISAAIIMYSFLHKC